MKGRSNLAVVAVRIAFLLDGDVLGVMVAVEISKARRGAEETAGPVEHAVRKM